MSQVFLQNSLPRTSMTPRIISESSCVLWNLALNCLSNTSHHPCSPTFSLVPCDKPSLSPTLHKVSTFSFSNLCLSGPSIITVFKAGSPVILCAPQSSPLQKLSNFEIISLIFHFTCLSTLYPCLPLILENKLKYTVAASAF